MHPFLHTAPNYDAMHLSLSHSLLWLNQQKSDLKRHFTHANIMMHPLQQTKIRCRSTRSLPRCRAIGFGLDSMQAVLQWADEDFAAVVSRNLWLLDQRDGRHQSLYSTAVISCKNRECLITTWQTKPNIRAMGKCLHLHSHLTLPSR